MATTSPVTGARRAPSWTSTAAATGIAAVGGLLVTGAIASAARGLFDVPPEFQPLNPSAFGGLTVIGVLAGAIGWHLVVARARRAAAVLRWLVPTVVVLSLIPDVAMLVDRSIQPGITTAGVVALMLMHVGVAAVGVPTYRRFIPPKTG